MHLRKDQRGVMDPLMFPLIIAICLVVGLAGFGIWSYLQFLDQRDNTDTKIAVAITEAEAIQKETLETAFAEREKAPYSTWQSSGAIGSIELTYPRTWSGFIEEKDTGSKPLSAFFHPNVVSSDDTTRYALRIFVDEKNYSKEVGTYDSDVENGLVTSKPFTVAGVTGVRLDGQIDKDYSGAIVILPLRDKTVRIWTESEAYLKDFNDIVLANLNLDK